MQLGTSSAARQAGARPLPAAAAAAAAGPARHPRPRAARRVALRTEAASGRRQRGLDGVQRGPEPPPQPGQQPLDESQVAEDLLALNGAIDKSYRARLLQFKIAATPEHVAALRDGLPPHFQADLDALLREAAALDESDFPPLPQEGDPLEAGPYALTPEEREAWELMQEPVLPDNFVSYLSQMFPEETAESDMLSMLDRLPPGVLQELQALFGDLQEFERSGDADPASVAARFQDLSDRMDRLGEEVALMQGAVDQEDQDEQQQQRQQQQLYQQQQQRQQQRQQWQAPLEAVRDAGSFASGASGPGRGRLFNPEQPASQQSRRQPQQQRRPMGVS